MDIKKVLFIMLYICSVNVLMAQDEVLDSSEKKFEIRVSNGATFPLGNFKSTEGVGAGYAKNGYKGAFDISYKLANNFGVAFIVNYNTQGTDATKKAEVYLHSNPSYTSIIVKSGSYSVLSFLIAPEYSIDLSDEFYVHGQFGLGVANVQGAEEHITVSSSSPYEERRTAGSQNSLAYQGKVSLNYKPNSTFGLGLYSSYFATNPQFTVEGIDVEQKINTVSIGIQFIYNF
ncbi:MAG: hypothetical protein ACI83H_002981 [Glaciecola sp.]|jgi:hypothetical protein